MNFLSKLLVKFLILCQVFVPLHAHKLKVVSPVNYKKKVEAAATSNCTNTQSVPIGCLDLCFWDSKLRGRTLCPFQSNGRNTPYDLFKNDVSSTSLSYVDVNSFKFSMLDILNLFRGATASEDTSALSIDPFSSDESQVLPTIFKKFYWRSPKISNMHKLSWDDGLHLLAKESLTQQCGKKTNVLQMIDQFDELSPNPDAFAAKFSFPYNSKVDKHKIFGWTTYIPTGGVTQELLSTVVTRSMALYWFTRIGNINYQWIGKDSSLLECVKSDAGRVDMQCIFMKRMIYGELCSIGCDYSTQCGKGQSNTMLTCFAYGFASDLKPEPKTDTSNGKPYPFQIGDVCTKCNGSPAGVCANPKLGLCQCKCSKLNSHCSSDTNCCSNLVCLPESTPLNTKDDDSSFIMFTRPRKVCQPRIDGPQLENVQQTPPPQSDNSSGDSPTTTQATTIVKTTSSPKTKRPVNRKQCQCDSCECRGGITILTLKNILRSSQYLLIKQGKSVMFHGSLQPYTSLTLKPFVGDLILPNTLSVECGNKNQVDVDLSCHEPVYIGKELGCGLFVFEGQSLLNGRLCDINAIRDRKFNQGSLSSGEPNFRKPINHKMSQPVLKKVDSSQDGSMLMKNTSDGKHSLYEIHRCCEGNVRTLTFQALESGTWKIFSKDGKVPIGKSKLHFYGEVSKNSKFTVLPHHGEEHLGKKIVISSFPNECTVEYDTSCNKKVFIGQRIGCKLKIVFGTTTHGGLLCYEDGKKSISRRRRRRRRRRMMLKDEKDGIRRDVRLMAKKERSRRLSSFFFVKGDGSSKDDGFVSKQSIKIYKQRCDCGSWFRPPVTAKPKRSVSSKESSEEGGKKKDEKCHCDGGLTSLSLQNIGEKDRIISVSDDDNKMLIAQKNVQVLESFVVTPIGKSTTLLPKRLFIKCTLKKSNSTGDSGEKDDGFEYVVFPTRCQETIYMSQKIGCGLVIIDAHSVKNGQLCVGEAQAKKSTKMAAIEKKTSKDDSGEKRVMSNRECCNGGLTTLTFRNEGKNGKYTVYDSKNGIVFSEELVKAGAIFTIIPSFYEDTFGEFIVINHKCKVYTTCGKDGKQIHIKQSIPECDVSIVSGQSKHGGLLCDDKQTKNYNGGRIASSLLNKKKVFYNPLHLQHKTSPNNGVGSTYRPSQIAIPPTRQPKVRASMQCCHGMMNRLTFLVTEKDINVNIKNEYGFVLYDEKLVKFKRVFTIYPNGKDRSFGHYIVINHECIFDTSCKKLVYIGQYAGCGLKVIGGMSVKGASICDMYGNKPLLKKTSTRDVSKDSKVNKKSTGSRERLRGWWTKKL